MSGRRIDDRDSTAPDIGMDTPFDRTSGTEISGRLGGHVFAANRVCDEREGYRRSQRARSKVQLLNGHSDVRESVEEVMQTIENDGLLAKDDVSSARFPRAN